jgi:hypothetical protein
MTYSLLALEVADWRPSWSTRMSKTPSPMRAFTAVSASLYGSPLGLLASSGEPTPVATPARPDWYQTRMMRVHPPPSRVMSQ